MWLERFEAFCCHVQFSSVQYDPFVIIIHTSNDNEPSSQFPGNIFMFTHRLPTKPTVCLCSQHQKVCRNFARKVSVIECINIESGLLTVLPPRTGAWPRSCWGCSPRAWWSGTWRTTTRPAFRWWCKGAPSDSQSVFTIPEKAPTRAFFWLKAPTSAFTFKTLLRHYANQTARLLWPLRRGPNFTLRDRGVNACLA